MVCDGPDPPENNPHELTPPPRHDMMMVAGNFEDSDEEQNDHFGYELLPQGPEGHHSNYEMCNEDDEMSSDEQPAPENVPSIEPIESTLAREVWNSPRPSDSIEMDNERTQQVMSAMANFALPQASIPDWAQCISEDQWKQTLQDRIERLKGNR